MFITIMLKIIQWSLFILGGLLVVDGCFLFFLGKINFGTVVPFLVGGIFLGHACFWNNIAILLQKRRWLKKLWTIAWITFFIWLLSFVFFIIILQRQLAKVTSVIEPKAMIILGAGTVKGKPSLALANRLDSALPFINQYPKSIVITSGGVGLGKHVSEAHIMAEYLIKQHLVPSHKIHEENKSTSTEENLSFSQEILKRNGIKLTDTIAIITNDFHTIRAKLIAEKQGYQNVVTIPSPTPLSIRYNAWFREYFAFVSGWVLREY